MYVGQSNDIEERYIQHCRGHDADDMAIDRAILKYGSDNFTYDIIEELPNDIDILHEREKYWVKFYNTYEDRNHYNLTPGGEGLGSGEEHPSYIPLDNDMILKLAKEGKNFIEIGEIFGVGRNTISRRLKKMVPADEYDKYAKNRYNYSNNKDIFALYKQGYSPQDISNTLNINVQVVRSRLKNMLSEEEYNRYKENNRNKIKIDSNILLDYVSQDMSINKIAEKMNVSEWTIRKHLKNIMSNVDYADYINRIRLSQKKDIDEKEVLELANQGISIRKIADKMNVGDITISKRLKNMMSDDEYRIYVSKNVPKPKIDVNEVLKLADQKFNMVEIGKKMGFSPHTIRKHLKKNMSDDQYDQYKKNVRRKNSKPKKRQNNKKKINYNKLLELADKGVSMTSISEQMNISTYMVKKHLKQIMMESEYNEYINKRKLEHRKKLSRKNNTSGYLNVSKYKRNDSKQTLIWQYKYYENGKRKSLHSVDLNKLKKKVKARGLPWKKI